MYNTLSPKSEIDELEFELDSLDSDYNANSSSDSRGTDSKLKVLRKYSLVVCAEKKTEMEC